MSVRFERSDAPEQAKVQPQVKAPEPIWKRGLDGPVFAPLAYDRATRSVIVGTDAGILTALAATNGSVRWSAKLGAPIRAAATVARDGIYGFRLAVENRKACCDVRKVRPLKRALQGAKGWVTGLRREQSAGRAHVPFASWDAENALFKFNPIADWSLDKLEAYVAEHDIPVNPLHARGFPSIGCRPCTRAIKPGEDIRAGRWWWENEDGKECGLHNRPRQKDAAA